MNSTLIVAVVAVGVILLVLGILIGLLVSRERNSYGTRASATRSVQVIRSAPAPPPAAGPRSPQIAPNDADTVLGAATDNTRDVTRSDGPIVVACGDYLTNGRFRNTQEARIGKEGEDKVVAAIKGALDGRWYVLRNLILPDSNTGDIDIVLVGPGGTYAFEVKAYSGSWRVENGKWYKQTSNGRWAHKDFGPGAQARDGAIRLCNFLKENGMTSGVAVNPVVVVAQDARIDFVSAGTKIWRLSDLPDKLAELNKGRYHSAERVQQIASLLMAQVYTSASTLPN